MGTRKVAITQVTPQSAFRVGATFAVIGYIVTLVAVSLVYAGMALAGYVDTLNSLIGGVGGESLVSYKMVLAATAVLGLIWAILIAILAPLTAVIYNAVVDLFGGLTLEVYEGKGVENAGVGASKGQRAQQAQKTEKPAAEKPKKPVTPPRTPQAAEKVKVGREAKPEAQPKAAAKPATKPAPAKPAAEPKKPVKSAPAVDKGPKAPEKGTGRSTKMENLPRNKPSK